LEQVWTDSEEKGIKKKKKNQKITGIDAHEKATVFNLLSKVQLLL